VRLLATSSALADIANNLTLANCDAVIAGMKDARDRGIRMDIESRFLWEKIGQIDGARQIDEARQQNFASQYGRRPPDKAADWAISSGRDNLLPAIINACPDSKYNEMGNWLTAHADSEFFSKAAEIFATRIESTDPIAATKWRDAATGK
jgi:hypothetical protein